MSMWRVAYKYALICGIFFLLSFWISYRFSGNPLVDPKHLFFDLIIISLFIYFSCKEFKTYRNGGILHFWQGMSLSYMTIIPAAVLFFVGLYVMMEFDSGIIDSYRVQSIQYLDTVATSLSEMSDDEIEELKRVSLSTTTFERASIAFRNKIIAGLIVSPVIAIILRKKP